MPRIVVLLCLLFSLYNSVQAQDEADYTAPEVSQRRYALGMTLGAGGLVVRDNVISNFLYSGTYVPLGFHFENRNRFDKFYINLEFANSPKLHTSTNNGFEYKGDLGQFFPNDTNGLDFSTLKTKMSSVNFTQLFMLRKSEDCKIRTFFGYELNRESFQKTFLQFAYTNKLTDRVTSLGFVTNFERNFNQKHHLEYNLSVPLISYASRTLYNSDSDPTTISSSKFSVLSKVIGFDSRFTYRFQVSSGFSLRASYEFHYLQVSFPEKEQWAYNQGVLGVFFHF